MLRRFKKLIQKEQNLILLLEIMELHLVFSRVGSLEPDLYFLSYYCLKNIFANCNHENTHPMGYLRILCNIESCRVQLGRGPWKELERVIKILYPFSLASHVNSQRVISESIPIE